MRRTTLLAVASFSTATLLFVESASAQYKNSAFSLDLAGWQITKPDILDGTGQLKPLDRRPLRLSSGLRVGGETAFKMNDDHWWFVGRFNVGFLRFIEDEGERNAARVEFDRTAADTLGTLLGLQAVAGLRYVVLTDRFRPYVQASISYMRLFSFSTRASADCGAALDLCDTASTSSNMANFLPHPNVGGLHIEPGIEYVFLRDAAFRVFVDLQHWIVLNAEDNRAAVIGGGFAFFT